MELRYLLPGLNTSNLQTSLPFVLAGLAGALVTLLFWPTVQSIIRIWSVSETFTHGFFVVPVFVWLVWRKRTALRSLPTQPDLRALLFIFLAGAMWLLSKLAGIQVGEQLAFALILVSTLWAVLGRRIAAELKFPLLFLLFLAPVGEELVPILMEITADMTVWAIRHTGIPIYREGLYFSLPSGNWSVVEACSGIRYLIASSVLGSLYAYLSYSSLKLRLAFIAISLLVPIIANSMRAYIIVMLGHFSGNKLATGVDHLVYGWLFFGIVMFALFSIGALLIQYDKVATDGQASNEKLDSQRISLAESVSDPIKGMGTQFAAMAAIFAVVASWPAWSAAINARGVPANGLQTTHHLLPQGQAAYSESTFKSTAAFWQPRNSGHDLRLDATFENDNLPPVRALAFVYETQQQGKEMVSSGNVLARSHKDAWRLGQVELRQIALNNGIDSHVREYRLIAGNNRLVVWQWYRVGDSITANPFHVKLLEVRDRLLLRSSPSVNYMLAVDESATDKEIALISTMSIIVD